ncbi:MAG TPA: hypothetical protein VFS23_20545 [Vicinamibacterales bacterium]|nr:hypothetical protein [Vicinamibacterales bacterium]
MMADTRATTCVLMCLLFVCAHAARAHDGPPYPIVSNQLLGPYRISVWTDPDTTDDGTPGGQFWVMIDAASAGASLAPDVRAQVTVRPLDRAGSPVSGKATPVNDDPARQFVALTMDHEGRFAVSVEVEGTTGRASADAEVLATYDSRPSRVVLAVYLVPFVLVGFLWTTLLIRRRRAHARPRNS